jgi:hypothetical protein
VKNQGRYTEKRHKWDRSEEGEANKPDQSKQTNPGKHKSAGWPGIKFSDEHAS